MDHDSEEPLEDYESDSFNERKSSEMWIISYTNEIGIAPEKVDAQDIECVIGDVVFDEYELMVGMLKSRMNQEISSVVQDRYNKETKGLSRDEKNKKKKHLKELEKPWYGIINAMECHKLLLQFWNSTARTWIHDNFHIYAVKIFVDHRKLDHMNPNNE